MSVKYVTRRAEDKKWCVKNAKASKATRVFSTQKEAIQYAGSLKSTTSIMVQSKEGKFRKVSTWDGVKKPVAAKPAAKKETATKKPAAKPATKKATAKPTAKPTAKKAPVKKPVVTEEKNNEKTIIDTKERVIQELKAQNDALDKQLAEEEAAKKAEKETTQTKEEKAREEKAIAKKESGDKSSRIKLIVAFIFLLIVIAVGVLFVADWKDWIKFMDVIKK